jgi:catechol 2,3-dioxygenase-like lactoylglutathione lyase family enzyme
MANPRRQTRAELMFSRVGEFESAVVEAEGDHLVVGEVSIFDEARGESLNRVRVASGQLARDRLELRLVMYVPEVLIEGLDHVQIAAPPGCEAEARRFFSELLGLLEIEKPELLRARGGVWFQIGHQQLHIGVEKPFVPAQKAHPAFRVRPETLEVLAGRLEAAGARVQWDEAVEDVRRFYTEDPWGNRIELLAAR